MTNNYFSKNALLVIFVCAGFFSKAQTTGSSDRKQIIEATQGGDYQFKTSQLADKSWEYVISKKGTIVFRSSESTAHPNRFMSEAEALAAAKIKAAQLDGNK